MFTMLILLLLLLSLLKKVLYVFFFLLLFTFQYSLSMNPKYKEKTYLIKITDNESEIKETNENISKQYQKCILELQGLKTHSNTSCMDNLLKEINTIQILINKHEKMPQNLQQKLPYQLKLKKYDCLLKCYSCCRKNSLSDDEKELNKLIFVDDTMKIQKSLLPYLQYCNTNFKPKSCCDTYFCGTLFLVKYLYFLAKNNKS